MLRLRIRNEQELRCIKTNLEEQDNPEKVALKTKRKERVIEVAVSGSMVRHQNHSDGIAYHAQSQSSDEDECSEHSSLNRHYWIPYNDYEMIHVVNQPSNQDNSSEECDDSVNSDKESSSDSKDDKWTRGNNNLDNMIDEARRMDHVDWLRGEVKEDVSSMLE